MSNSCILQVSVIQSCSHGINKLIEALQNKFPHIAKSQLRSKVREIADFSDNRWQVSYIAVSLVFCIPGWIQFVQLTIVLATQVKKDILVKLGLSVSPGISPCQNLHILLYIFFSYLEN